MTVASTSRLALTLTALVIAGGIALALSSYYGGREPRADIKAPTTSQAAPEPSSGARDRTQSALAAAQAGLDAAATALTGPSSPSESKDGEPAFDVARIEPTGEAVIAGRAAPGATVELLRDGELHDRVVADESGQFAMVPPRLPPGTYGLTLRSTLPDGKQMTSKQRVAVALEPNPNDRPIAAMTDKSNVLPSQTTTNKTISEALVVDAIEVEPTGKFHVTGRATPSATVRLYLNNSLVASVVAGADQRFAIAINEGVTPGSYRVKLDEIGPNSGAVHGHLEMPFNVPDRVATGSTATTPSGRSDRATQPQLATTTPSTVSPDRGSPSTVVVPKITTAKVSRGDSLWSISRLSYGVGMRYAAIYQANRKYIRNPNLIYPGQTFVVPTR
jgi:nucleoid-associated protein YgaU